MNVLTINGSQVKTDANGLVSLTDLYNMAALPGKRSPSDWSRESGAKFIADLAKSLHTQKTGIYKTSKARQDRGGGTYAHWQIALAYAQYLSTELHRQVNAVYARYISNDITLADDVLQKATQADAMWLAKRAQGKVARIGFTDTLKGHGVDKYGFATCTDAINRHVLGGTAKEAKKQRGVSAKGSLRDTMTIDELVATSMSELVASRKIEREQIRGNQMCTSACGESAAKVHALLIGGAA